MNSDYTPAENLAIDRGADPDSDNWAECVEAAQWWIDNQEWDDDE